MLGEEARRFASLRDKNSRHIVVAPILHGYLLRTYESGGQTRISGLVLEKGIAEIAIKPQSPAAGQHGEQIEFAGEIQIRQHAVATLQRFQPRHRTHLANAAVRADLENV